MRESCVLLVASCLSLVVWGAGGCNAQPGSTHSEAPTASAAALSGPAESQPPYKNSTGLEGNVTASPESGRTITMKQIWDLRKQGACKELVEAVDIFLRGPRIDENTKGTCLFLKGDSQRQLGNLRESEVTLQMVIADYNDTRWPDPNVRGGTVPVRPQVNVALRLVAEQDKSRFPEDSNSYTSLAWKYLDKQRFDTAVFFAWQCIRRFQSDALMQQRGHRSEYGENLPKLPPDPKKNEPILQRYWALYDVGTCCFVLGQAYESEADRTVSRGSMQEARRLYEEALRAYNKVITEYPGAQCFDPRGPWYWGVKAGSEERINRITADKLKKVERR